MKGADGEGKARESALHGHGGATRQSLSSETPPSHDGYVMEKLAVHHIPQATRCFASTFAHGEILAHAVSLSQHDMIDFARKCCSSGHHVLRWRVAIPAAARPYP